MSGTDISANKLPLSHIRSHNAQSNAMTRDGTFWLVHTQDTKRAVAYTLSNSQICKVSVSLKEVEVCVHHALSLHLHTKHCTTAHHPFYQAAYRLIKNILIELIDEMSHYSAWCNGR